MKSLKNQRSGARQQLSLDLGGASGLAGSDARNEPPVSQDNLFFAAVPDCETAEETAKRAADVCGRYGHTAKLRPQRVYHVSLLSLGMFAGLPEHILGPAKDAGARVHATSFNTVFDRYTSFNAGKNYAGVFACGQGNAEFVSLYRALCLAVRAVGLRVLPTSSFSPHLTFLYSQDYVEETPLAHPIDWKVHEFALVHSVYGATRHEYLARWQLDG